MATVIPQIRTILVLLSALPCTLMIWTELKQTIKCLQSNNLFTRNNVEYNRHFYIQIITNVTDFPLKDDRGLT